MSGSPVEPWGMASVEAGVTPFTMSSPAFASATMVAPRRLACFSSTGLPPALDRAAMALDLAAHPVALTALFDGSAIITDLAWLRLDQDPGAAALIALRQRIADEALHIVVETSVATIDLVWTILGDSDGVAILLDPDESDCLLALSQALRTGSFRLNSPLADPRDQQLDRLQEEVQRISRLLARLSVDQAGRVGHIPDGSREPPSPFIEDHHVHAGVRGYHADGSIDASRAPVSAHQVRLLIRQRRLREEFFDAEFFADPAWDMMLDLYAARLERMRVSVSSLCIAAAVPATTALRWIKSLTDAGVFERRDDPHDGRRIFVALGDGATQAMHGYFRRLENDI